MAAPLGRDTLPEHWSYGVCKDGRVFFVNDETHTTTWLHPRTAEPVNSGHMIRSDLPRGWEEGFTDEGASYFLNHNQRATTFLHPGTGQVSADSVDFILQEQPSGRMSRLPAADLRPSSTVSEASTAVTTSTADTTSVSKGSRLSVRVHSFGKRDQAIKRNPNVPVVVRGWLYKQDSSGMRLWKRKWFVLADYCLFYYKDSREESVLGSIPLPSYVISAVEPEDHISRKYAFKASHTGMRSYIYNRNSMIGSQAEHSGMRTYFFSADTQEDMHGWVKAMNQAALMQNHTTMLKRPSDSQKSENSNTSECQAVPQTNHIITNHTKTTPEVPNPLADGVALEPVEIHRDTEDGASIHPNPPSVTEIPRTIDMKSFPTNPLDLPFDSASVSAPVSRAPSCVPSRAPSRAASTLPPSVFLRNGLIPSPVPEPNGIGAGTYQRATLPPMERQLQRRSALEQVEDWVQVQKGEHKVPTSREGSLPRRTPPTQPKFGRVETYQSLPKTPRHSPPAAARHGEYKYAQDRLSHFHLTPDPQTGTLSREGMGPGGTTVWQLYEWQQRHQFRHGSPTAPLYTPAPDYPFGPRPPSTVPPSAPRPSSEVPRCISVPPSPSDIPPPGPPPGYGRTLSPPRRPHMPADRVTVRPMGERSALDMPLAGSPRRAKSQLLKTSTIERRSMPSSGYITHTVSAPSLHGKTADDTYMQLKKDLEYLDLKVVGSQTLKDAGKPVKVAESDVDVKLSRLCEQDKILKALGTTISSLKDDKDKLESVLDVSHQQMEQYQGQPTHAEKIAFQQRLLQEDLVHIRAEVSGASTEMAKAWDEYSRIESSVEQLRTALHAQMNHSATPQEKAEIKRELWRIEDVMAGLSSSKANYMVTIDSVQNPERKVVPFLSDSAIPTQSVTLPGEEIQPPPRSSQPSPASHTLPHNTVPNWAADEAPPRPPLPQLYDYEDAPPVVPPLPKEASAIRHMSVRGLKRQSDERKRDRESGHVTNGDCKVELRSYLSEPELPGMGHTGTGFEDDHHTLPNRGLSSSSSRLNQSSNISSYVTLRRGAPGSLGRVSHRERPRSALERLNPDSQQVLPVSSSQPRGRMSAEEQLERMKKHQRALVRERKRNLSHGDRFSNTGASSRPAPPSSSVDLGPQQQQRIKTPLEERQRAEGQSDEGSGVPKEREKLQLDEWMTVIAKPMREMDLDPLDYDLDISRELSKPQKVLIPERYVESDPDEPLSQEEMDQRSRRADRIKNILAKSSVQHMPPSGAGISLDFTDLDSALQQQERIMSVSHALASEASRKSKEVTAKAVSEL
ncbi:pleckstrin homology domain-containing family A member 7 isoform X3 [Hypomesus transpacificus]|uniref:pleckstrin homology domain-containing family A member 7 isoform X3 n=1 Tax=Hypomesus transpacificus TaxID=137520 RepID=UPI001F078948|nr:pleckstrin homology domain-containing family A member 7 isoform X3 [Hypomesus transpacificus]